MAEQGYINGYEDGTYRPDNEVTRLETILLFARAMGSNAFDALGKRYIMQMTMQDMVISYLCENVTIQ